MTDRYAVGWKAIAEYLGLSEWEAKHLFRRAGISLPKIGTQGRTSCVYLDTTQLFSATLKSGIRGLIVRKTRVSVSTRAN